MTDFIVKESPPIPESIRQTMVARYDVCPHSAYLGLKQAEGDGARNHAMNRGIIFHAFAEQATKEMIAQGEKKMPGDLARENMIRTIKEHEEDYPVPIHEKDALRGMAHNWGECFTLPAGNVDVEHQLTHRWHGEPIGVHGTLDLICENAAEHNTLILDYKTGLYVPAQEEYEKSFQGIFYAWLAYNAGYKLPIMHAQVYPRHTSGEDMVSRRKTYGEQDLYDFGQDVRSLMDSFTKSFATRSWPAVPGDHCWSCPAPQECPIPEAYRPVPIEDEESARKQAHRHMILKSEVTRLNAELKAYAEDNGAIPLDDEYELGFTVVESEVLRKDAREEMKKGATRDTLFEKRTSTRFGRMKKDG
jgi:hypothetical protein